MQIVDNKNSNSLFLKSQEVIEVWSWWLDLNFEMHKNDKFESIHEFQFNINVSGARVENNLLFGKFVVQIWYCTFVMFVLFYNSYGSKLNKNNCSLVFWLVKTEIRSEVMLKIVSWCFGSIGVNVVLFPSRFEPGLIGMCLRENWAFFGIGTVSVHVGPYVGDSLSYKESYRRINQLLFSETKKIVENHSHSRIGL